MDRTVNSLISALKLNESHMNNFPYFDYYGDSGKIYDEYRPEEHVDSGFKEDYYGGQEEITVDVADFAMRLADAIADVFEEMFGDKLNSGVSTQEIVTCVESAILQKQFSKIFVS